MRKTIVLAIAATVAMSIMLTAVGLPAASIYQSTSGSWNTATAWTPNGVPNAVGAAVQFDTPTAARTVTTDSGAAGFTVGSITFNENSAFANTLSTGTAGSNLKLDNAGAGVLLQFNGTGASLANT